MTISKIDITTYAAFYEKNKILFSVFSQPDWISIYDERLQIFGIYNDNKDIIGSFYLYQRKRKGIPYITNPPYTPNIGLTYINPAEKLHQKNTFTKKILEGIAHYIDQHCKTFAYVSLSPEIIDSQPFTWKGFNAVPNYTYQSDLSQSEVQLLEAMSPKKRNAYKKAIKDNLTVNSITDLAILKSLIQNTFQRKAKSIDMDLIDKILNTFATNQNSFCYATYQNHQALAAAFCIYDSKKCYYLLSGYDQMQKHQGAGILAVFECMKRAKQLGLSIFDFEGSMLPEVEDYFREFGGKLVPYNTLNKAYGLYKKPMKLAKGNQF
jgi:hypothetical protein